MPLWRVPALAQFLPRQRKALDAVALIRRTTEELIAKCKEMVDAEEQVSQLWWRVYLPHSQHWPCQLIARSKWIVDIEEPVSCRLL